VHRVRGRLKAGQRADPWICDEISNELGGELSRDSADGADSIRPSKSLYRPADRAGDGRATGVRGS